MNILESLKKELEIRTLEGQDIAKIPEIISYIEALLEQLSEANQIIEKSARVPVGGMKKAGDYCDKYKIARKGSYPAGKL